MKYRKIILEQLRELPYFTKNTVRQLCEPYSIQNATVDAYISRSLKNKDIISLKKGLYISTDFYNNSKRDISYLFYLANVIRQPSYISSWTALQYYNMATEIIHTITSITPKITRNYKTKIGTFSYQNIKEDLFTDFSLIESKFSFFIASPSKALFDLLYFKTNQFRGVKYEDIDLLIEELRIDTNEMDKGELEKFYSIIKNYISNG
ncbi:MAG: hypothetical protein KKH94_13930 [Candidatus Omnitrophica bacterium]|nr:hypothetical protein [Candidatus Omnitrophota bacterium]